MELKTNLQRRKCWERLHELYGIAGVNKAMATLKPDTARVLELHYREEKPFAEICLILKRSITVIRDHHNRGIFKLDKYFRTREKRK